MWESIMNALKGVGSGIGGAFQQDEGGFDWNKLLGATEAFGQGMGPDSQVGQAMSNVSGGVRAGFQQHGMNKANKMRKAQAESPIAEESADGVPGTLNLPNPSASNQNKTAGPYASEPDAAPVPTMPPLPDPIQDTEWDEDKGMYKRIGGRPLFY
jgi:hypothetical protein